MVANCKMAFLTLDPACRDGTVNDGGFVNKLMISVVAWIRKLLMEILGNLICLGKNTTVSVVTSALDEGTKHFTHL